MKIKGKIISIQRSASARDGKDAVLVRAKVELESPGEDFWLVGYEPEISFELNQVVVVTVGGES